MTNSVANLKVNYLTKKALPYWCILTMDCLLILMAGILATYLCDGGHSLVKHFWDKVMTWICIVPLYIIGMKAFHTSRSVLRYTTTIDFVRVLMAQALGLVLLIVAKYVMPETSIIGEMRLIVLIVATLISLTGQWGMRIFMKYVFEALSHVKRNTNIFIYGAREGAVSIARSINSNKAFGYNVVGFVSTDGNLDSKYLMGVKVRKDGINLVDHMKDERATVLIVSPLQIDVFRQNQELVQKLMDANIKIMMMSDPEEWTPNAKIEKKQIHDVSIEDLLPRDKIEVNMQAIGLMLQNKCILITGAAGSIGSEMVRQVARFDPKHLILIDQAETPMHDVRLYMAKKYPNIKCQTIVTSICNQTHMEELFSEYRPEYVFHAAAYKHVPMMEDNPAMAVQNNVYGTRVIADLAVKYGAKKFVMISTDKAVNPTNVMGCSKRICEIYCQAYNKAIENLHKGDANGYDEKISKELLTQADGKPAVTQFITTRFGNVLGSNGSVIPIFREQIKKGGPLTVTHPDIIRFFMLIPEACQLVLQAGTMGKGGEIFVFDMGKPVKIADLAKRMIKLSGAKDIKIVYTGLRDGEKLYEEVLNDEEQTKPTTNKKIKVAAVREYAFDKALENEKQLHELSFTYDDMKIVAKMKEIVPEYKSQHSKYEALDK